MNCLTCGRKIPGADINIQKLVATCRSCEEVFSFAEQFRVVDVGTVPDVSRRTSLTSSFAASTQPPTATATPTGIFPCMPFCVTGCGVICWSVRPIATCCATWNT